MGRAKPSRLVAGFESPFKGEIIGETMGETMGETGREWVLCKMGRGGEDIGADGDGDGESAGLIERKGGLNERRGDAGGAGVARVASDGDDIFGYMSCSVVGRKMKK